MEIDIELGEIVRHYGIDSKEPTFMALQGELILVAPNEICEDARGELERTTLALSRHLSDAGSFEG